LETEMRRERGEKGRGEKRDGSKIEEDMGGVRGEGVGGRGGVERWTGECEGEIRKKCSERDGRASEDECQVT
jgi:hypothetical protein